MKKLILVLLLLFLIPSSIAYNWNVTPEDAGLVHYEILGFEIWHLEKGNDVVEKLELQTLKGDDLNKAKISHLKLEDSYRSCVDIGDTYTSYKFWILVLGPVGLSSAIIELGLDEISQNTVSNCLDYGKHWRSTINSAFFALDNRYLEFSSSCKQTSELYKRLTDSGICEYVDQSCDNLEAISMNCNGNYYVGEFSDFSKIYLYMNKLNDQIDTNLDFTNYPLVMRSLEDEDLKKIEDEIILGNQVFEDLLNSYQEKSRVVTLVRDEFEAKKNILLNQDVEKINSGSLNVQSISSSFNLALQKSKSASLYFNDSKKYSNQEKLGLALESLDAAHIIYSDLIISLEEIQSESLVIVDLKEDEAKSKLELFESENSDFILNSASQEYLQRAKSNIKDADESDSLGEKYEHYQNSIKFVNLASSYKEDGKLEADFDSKLEYLRDLVERAKADGLDVYYYENLLDKLEISSDPEKIIMLDELENDVIGDAKLRFSSLNDERSDLLNLLNVDRVKFSNHIEAMNNLDDDYLSNGKISVPKAIGNLSYLEEQYTILKEQILFDIEDLKNSLQINANSKLRGCKIGDSCTLEIEVIVYNPFDLFFEKPKISIDNSYDVSLYNDNIIYGNEYVDEITTTDSINLYFKNMESLKTYRVVIKEEIDSIIIENLEIYSQSNSDRSAYLEYYYELDASESIQYAKLPDVNGEIVDVRLNGINQIISGSTISNIGEGENSLFIRTIIPDALSIKKLNYNSINLGVMNNVNYDLIIKPEIDLQKSTIVVDDGVGSSVESFSVSSYSGNKITNKQFLESGKLIFDINDLVKGQEHIVKVSYDLNDPVAYAEEVFHGIDISDLDPTSSSLLDDFELAMSLNNTPTAIEKIKELESRISKIKKDQEKTSEKFNSIKQPLVNELNEIRNFLSTEPIQEEFITKLKVRESELSNIEYLQSDESNLTKLEKIDDSWIGKNSKDFIKRMEKRYNLAKTQILDLGIFDEVSKDAKSIEDLIYEFEVTYNLTRAGEILESIEELENYINSENQERDSEKDENFVEFSELKSSIELRFDHYSNLYDSAKGGSLEDYFKYQPNSIKSKLSNFENNFDSMSYEKIVKELSEIKKMDAQVSSIIDGLENQAKNRIDDIRFIFSDLSGSEKEKLESSLTSLSGLIEEGKYVDVLYATDSIIESGQIEQDDSNYLFFVIVILITLLVIIYMLRDKIGKNIPIPKELRNIFKKKNREYRKLKRAED